MVNLTIGSKDKKSFDEYVLNRQEVYSKNFFTNDYLKEEFKKSWDNIIAKYDTKRDDPYRGSFIGGLIAINMNLLAGDVMDCALYYRYIHGRVEDLVNGIYTYGRLKYIGDIVTPFSYGENDVFYGRSILHSAAGNDLQMLQSYLKAIPGPPTAGHPLLKMLSIGLYGLISDNEQTKKEALVSLDKAMQMKTLGVWDKAVLSSISAIITLDAQKFTKSLHEVLRLHAKSPFIYGLQEYISLPAHSLYTFAYFAFEKAGLQPPDEPEHTYWDSEFWHAVKNAGQKREYIFDVRSVAPVLAQWMDELPTTLDYNLLLQK